MPFKSKAQNAWAHTLEGTKALGGPSKVKEWEGATDYSSLPKHVPAHAQGGPVMNKGYLGKTESFAKGGAVLGKNSEFLKTENRFLGRKLPEHGEAEETEDRFEKGAVNATTPAPKSKGKTESMPKPRGC